MEWKDMTYRQVEAVSRRENRRQTLYMVIAHAGVLSPIWINWPPRFNRADIEKWLLALACYVGMFFLIRWLRRQWMKKG